MSLILSALAGAAKIACGIIAARTVGKPTTETKFSDDKFVRPTNSNSQSKNDN